MTVIRVQAKIHLFRGPKKRKTAFRSGYRPAFSFEPGHRTSGQITLEGIDQLNPGEQATVQVAFIRENLPKGLALKGRLFTFFEGGEPFGEGVVLEVLE